MADGGVEHPGWRTFVQIYAPAIHRWLLSKGLAQADAEDCAQSALLSVFRSLHTYQDDHRPASFRRWLQRVVKNELINTLRKNSRSPRGPNDSRIWQALAEELAVREDADAQIEREYQTSLFLAAADEVRESVEEKTWLAFWKTQMEQKPSPVVAMELGLSVGSVYVAKGRVLKRLQQVVQRLEDPQ